VEAAGIDLRPPLRYNLNRQGCGGLLVLNRTMNVEAFRSGSRSLEAAKASREANSPLP